MPSETSIAARDGNGNELLVRRIVSNHEVSGCISLFSGLVGVIGCLATGGKSKPEK